MKFDWHQDLNDEDPHPGWVCSMTDGSEMFVEQSTWLRDGRPIWRSLVRFGENGIYTVITAAFKSRSEAQSAAEAFWASHQSAAVPVIL